MHVCDAPTFTQSPSPPPKVEKCSERRGEEVAGQTKPRSTETQQQVPIKLGYSVGNALSQQQPRSARAPTPGPRLLRARPARTSHLCTCLPADQNTLTRHYAARRPQPLTWRPTTARPACSASSRSSAISRRRARGPRSRSRRLPPVFVPPRVALQSRKAMRRRRLLHRQPPTTNATLSFPSPSPTPSPLTSAPSARHLALHTCTRSHASCCHGHAFHCP